MLALTILLLGMSGCGSRQSEERFRAWRQETGAAPVEFRAEIRAAAGIREADFTLRCRWENGETSVTVLAPEALEGISFRREAEQDILEYDGTILALEESRGGLSAATALPVLQRALSAGRLLSLGREGSGLLAELELPEEMTLRLWLDEEMNPQRAEWLEAGQSVLSARITDWKIGEQ